MNERKPFIEELEAVMHNHEKPFKCRIAAFGVKVIMRLIVGKRLSKEEYEIKRKELKEEITILEKLVEHYTTPHKLEAHDRTSIEEGVLGMYSICPNRGKWSNHFAMNAELNIGNKRLELARLEYGAEVYYKIIDEVVK
ncbi:hypothetical protein COU54_01770 [Candidatus Pacearchaeota archaeon CG10_big_fil_rev_8_21_14_0_10_31_24]|nr:MAG: hypothetical protein COU54_01770 [Candidatus Pacearchaeota archaeon CG10_big_fil_rev_8_21_14_0_10_31_24]